MGLPYPGGPVIDRLAKEGNPKAFRLAHPHVDGYDYSFSGLKTSFLYMLRDAVAGDPDFIERNKADLCASLQSTIVEILLDKLVRASKDTGIRDIAIAGGVSANSGLRNGIVEQGLKRGWRTFLPEFKFTTDNAAMIAMAGYYHYQHGDFSSCRPWHGSKSCNAAGKMKRLAAFVLLLAGIGSAYAGDGDAERLRAWRAGEKVSEEAVAEYGIDRCFASSEIGDALFARMYGKSYKPDCTVPRSELRYLRVLHRNLAGETLLGELVCNEAISGDLLEIFRMLYDAAYPIERMVLIDEYDAQDGPSMRANNSSAFNFRFIAGTGVLSNHSRGMAVDINPLYNPYVKTNGGRTVVAPAEAAPYAERKRDFPYKIAEDDPCCREFLRHGFTWGGHWKSLKDYQHFEKKQ